MIRIGWRRALPRHLVLVAAAALIPVLAGCEAGNDAPTIQFHYPTDAAGTAVGDLSIRNVFVLGTNLGTNLHKGQSASLFLAVITNHTSDRLVSVSAPGSAASVSVPAGGVPVVYGHPVFLTGPKPQLILQNLTRTIANGTTIKVILTFQKAGPITLLVPVFPRATHYQTYSPPPPSASPSVTPSTTATGRHHRRTHASAKPSASASTSPSPTPGP